MMIGGLGDILCGKDSWLLADWGQKGVVFGFTIEVRTKVLVLYLWILGKYENSNPPG